MFESCDFCPMNGSCDVISPNITNKEKAYISSDEIHWTVVLTLHDTTDWLDVVP